MQFNPIYWRIFVGVLNDLSSSIDLVQLPLENGLTREIGLLREDLLHPEVSGNKWRKLRYNIEAADQKGHHQILTFGGAFSNHIVATASAGKLFGIKTIGIIRGDGMDESNETLSKALEDGMTLHFVSRTDYKRKYEKSFQWELREKFGSFFMVPEGGANYWGVCGCMEILKEPALAYKEVWLPAGTGSTLSGIVLSANSDIEIHAVSVLKGGSFLEQDVYGFINLVLNQPDLAIEYARQVNWHLNDHCGGYGKLNEELISFIHDFYDLNGVALDGIYTGKMLLALRNDLKAHQRDASKILAIHTGGIQGNKGLNYRFKLDLPLG